MKRYILFFMLSITCVYAMQSPYTTLEMLNKQHKLQGKITKDSKKMITLQLNNLGLTTLDGLSHVIPPNLWHTIIKIDLSGNKLTQIHPELLEMCSKALLLDSINLSNNMITSLPSTFLKNAPNVTTVLCINNQIESVADDFLLDTPELIALDMSFNRLKSLPAGFLSKNSTIRSVLLQGNQIAHIPYGFLANAKQLEILNIDANPIEQSVKTRNYIVEIELSKWLIEPLQKKSPERDSVDTSTIPGFTPMMTDDDDGYGTEEDS